MLIIVGIAFIIWRRHRNAYKRRPGELAAFTADSSITMTPFVGGAGSWRGGTSNPQERQGLLRPTSDSSDFPRIGAGRGGTGSLAPHRTVTYTTASETYSKLSLSESRAGWIDVKQRPDLLPSQRFDQTRRLSQLTASKPPASTITITEPSTANVDPRYSELKEDIIRSTTSTPDEYIRGGGLSIRQSSLAPTYPPPSAPRA